MKLGLSFSGRTHPVSRHAAPKRCLLPPRVVPDQGYTGLCAACLRAAVISHGSRRRAASGSSSRHRRTSDESLMRRLARHALRWLCTSSAARSTWWVWSIRLARAPPSRPSSEEARARRTRLSHMDLPAHRATRQEGRKRARRWSRIPCYRMSWRSPLHVKLAGRRKHVVISLPSAVGVPVGRPWATLRPWRSLLDSAPGYTAPPMMVHGEHHNMGEVEQERALARWRACSGHQ